MYFIIKQNVGFNCIFGKNVGIYNRFLEQFSILKISNHPLLLPVYSIKTEYPKLNTFGLAFFKSKIEDKIF